MLSGDCTFYIVFFSIVNVKTSFLRILICLNLRLEKRYMDLNLLYDELSHLKLVAIHFSSELQRLRKMHGF